MKLLVQADGIQLEAESRKDSGLLFALLEGHRFHCIMEHNMHPPIPIICRLVIHREKEVSEEG